MNDFYSEDADRAFTLEIAKYNALSKTEKKHFRKQIVERTLILIYEIPLRFLFATEDQAVDIFLEANDEVDRIIENFRLCGITFNNYLIQVCRYKLLTELRKERERKLAEDSYLAEEEHLYRIDNDESQYGDSKALHSGIERPEVCNMSLKELFEYIAGHRDATDQSTIESENRLQEYLAGRISRRRFLIFLLYLPETETEELINDFSRVLDIDYKVIAQFFILKNSELNDHYIAREKSLMIASHHWNTIQKLRRALYSETDDEKADALRKKIQKVSRCHISRCKTASKALSGMTHQQISEMLGIPRSTITQSIGKVKERLAEIADDIIPE